MAKNGSPHPRVVSLIASSTEILNALGAGDLQVARSHECDYPPSVLKLPAITRPKFRVEGLERRRRQGRALARRARAGGLRRQRRSAGKAQARRHPHAGPVRGVRRVARRRGACGVPVRAREAAHRLDAPAHPGRHLRRHRPRRRSYRPSGGRQETRRLDAGALRRHRRQGRRTAEEEARLHRVGRPADVGRALDAGADRHRRRRQPVRHDGRAVAMDHLEGGRRRQSGRDPRCTVRLRHRGDRSGR